MTRCTDEVRKRKAEIIGTFMDTIRDMTDEKETIKELHKCYDKLNALPTADVRENAHAKWVIEKEIVNGVLLSGQFCSNCGYPQYLTTNYCPNCGAKMDL